MESSLRRLAAALEILASISTPIIFFGRPTVATWHFGSLADRPSKILFHSAFRRYFFRNHRAFCQTIQISAACWLVCPFPTNFYTLIHPIGDGHLLLIRRLADPYQNSSVPPSPSYIARRPAALRAINSAPPTPCRRFSFFISTPLHYACYTPVPCRVLIHRQWGTIFFHRRLQRRLLCTPFLCRHLVQLSFQCH